MHEAKAVKNSVTNVAVETIVRTCIGNHDGGRRGELEETERIPLAAVRTLVGVRGLRSTGVMHMEGNTARHIVHAILVASKMPLLHQVTSSMSQRCGVVDLQQSLIRVGVMVEILLEDVAEPIVEERFLTNSTGSERLQPLLR